MCTPGRKCLRVQGEILNANYSDRRNSDVESRWAVRHLTFLPPLKAFILRMILIMSDPHLLPRRLLPIFFRHASVIGARLIGKQWKVRREEWNFVLVDSACISQWHSTARYIYSLRAHCRRYDVTVFARWPFTVSERLYRAPSRFVTYEIAGVLEILGYLRFRFQSIEVRFVFSLFSKRVRSNKLSFVGKLSVFDRFRIYWINLRVVEER